MFTRIDAFLNRVTMYRLMLYYLCFLIIVTVVLSSFSFLAFKPLDIILSAVILTLGSFFTNKVLAWMFNAVTNTESSFITGLILALIIDPTAPAANLAFLLLAAVLAMSSKYLISISGRHIFNPVAFATFVAALTVSRGASWWVSNPVMAPFIVIAGLLILRKIRRFQMAAIFLLSYLLLVAIIERSEMIKMPLSTLVASLINSPILFFTFVMLIEPLTSPRKRGFQLYYGVIVALAYMLFQTLELALFTGNLFSYLTDPQAGIILKLKAKQKIARDTFNFLFEEVDKINFTPGQFLEWTLPHKNPDSRGNRRFFTVSSSPTENFITLTTKIYQDFSSFKKALLDMKSGDQIIATSLSGEFTLPKNSDKSCVFIAGGIGITPFRSMIKYMLDKKLSREIILFYSNKHKDEIVFQDVFDRAEKAFGLKTVYTLTDNFQSSWKGKTGHIDEKMIKQGVLDYKNKLFYISGPQPMVFSFEKMLKNIGISKNNIKVDYFSGYTD